MYKKLALVGLLAVVGAQTVSAEGYRNSDGSYSNKVGNTYYHSNGTYTTVDE